MTHYLTAVTYHYVRDLPRTRFPRLKGLSIDAFRQQLLSLSERFEMATLETALAFLDGRYQSNRDLCLLTFDDGLKEHFATVAPILAERSLQGLFFVPTVGIEEGRVLAVHKNHFLMAAVDFAEYRSSVRKELKLHCPDMALDAEPAKATATYRWDTPEVASLKYLLNFCTPEALRETILDRLFDRYLGDEEHFARELYVNWNEARAMQAAGMVIGGHTHSHTALSTLDDERQRRDLETCTQLLRRHLTPQPHWPFSYPYGRRQSYGSATLQMVRELDYCCAFTTENGSNQAGCDMFTLRRIDTNDVPQSGG